MFQYVFIILWSGIHLCIGRCRNLFYVLLRWAFTYSASKIMIGYTGEAWMLLESLVSLLVPLFGGIEGFASMPTGPSLASGS